MLLHKKIIYYELYIIIIILQKNICEELNASVIIVISEDIKKTYIIKKQKYFILFT